MPSSGMATASISAPASSAAFATGTAPCPYASALTTAKNRAPPGNVAFHHADIVADRCQINFTKVIPLHNFSSFLF